MLEVLDNWTEQNYDSLREQHDDELRYMQEVTRENYYKEEHIEYDNNIDVNSDATK